MINKRKIATMSSLSIYEKKHGKQDKKINNYFRYDYISRHNIVNIILVLIFSSLCVLIYQINNIYNEELIFNLEELKVAMNSSIWLIALITIAYSFIGFLVYSREFNEKDKRLKEYYANLKTLNE